MADEQLQRDQAQLRAAIKCVSNEALKTHMLAALDTFDASSSSSQATDAANTSPGFVRPPDRVVRGNGVPSPVVIPPVGGGDAFPPGLGGGNPDMLVGPDHPLFGRRGDPSAGPVPGARFDPFGPPIDPLGPSGIRPPPRGPAPTMPFGGPGPDHMRMPRDDDMDPGFGFGGGRNNRGGGGFSQPFGSNNAFF
ncbi:hypothetical protein PHYSODRAFT_331309 [Phytophthora sojae]|uniref:Uncharacterized protein n=1 Tax=Phytophthora sojae (strain P6497) TaxID=1094619 RepID=G4ZCK9_PHYSP|nr:hypothetical protein PHYSODRAFT_331309 [Phytophthora sojae]EGZ17326.1 hypothetical protein PHYSODRAFT_331309 [Phytophthora sojae]|eukprot:XP_009526384.1 hypothetical protein PHYSODRAFT_331309 [Phytophthora sojae]